MEEKTEVWNENDKLQNEKPILVEHETIRKNLISPNVLLKVRLSGDQPFWGPGIVRLLRQVDQSGSLLDACKALDMSYSKGRKLIRRAEEELGFNLVKSQAGGASGGKTTVTEDALAYVEKYERFQKELLQETYRLYDEIFG